MGYDSRIYVVRKGSVGLDNYAEVMAIYEMCVFPPFQKLFNCHCPVTKCEIYADDGNTLITEDRYGKPLQERSLEEVIECLDQIITLDDDTAHYVRVRPLMALLQEYLKIQSNWYRLAVLHYGH